MASEITLKYLHPSIKTYITTENYNYDTSVAGEVLFCADVFEHGKDNVIQQVTTVPEYLFKYGEPNFAKFGQAGYNIERWLTTGGTAQIMRLLPENAAFAHAVFNVQYKNATNGKTVLNNEGEETKIDDVYLRPLVTYIGVNKTSEKLIESELAEDRRDYPTTDGYIDNFIFAVYPEGRGEYYNDLGFRIRLNPTYDTMLTSRVYTFEILRYTDSGTFDIVDGPYYVSFDPEAIDPNSQKSMFIENVVNSYSEYVKVKVNNDNFVRLATIINDEVDPYIIDIITGQSRIMDNGQPETFYSRKTGKEEDVHISLHSYSSQGTVLSSNGNIILNISNNDEASSDIVDIADNARRVIYNNQYYATQYMRTFFNWLLNDKITQNLDKILQGDIESSIEDISGLLKDKAEELIYNHLRNTDDYSFAYKGIEKKDPRGAWYTKALEVALPGISINDLESGDTAEEKLTTGQVMNVVTSDGYVTDTKEHLLSYYHNFLKYFQYIANYDVIHSRGFIQADDYSVLKSKYDETKYENMLAYLATSVTRQDGAITGVTGTDSPVILHEFSGNGSDTQYIALETRAGFELLTSPVYPGGYIYSSNDAELYISIYNPAVGSNVEVATNPEVEPVFGDPWAKTNIGNYGYLNAYYYDENAGYHRPVYSFDKLYDANGKENINGDYIKTRDYNGDEILLNINSVIIAPKSFYVNQHLTSISNGTVDSDKDRPASPDLIALVNGEGHFQKLRFKTVLLNVITKKAVQISLNNSGVNLHVNAISKTGNDPVPDPVNAEAYVTMDMIRRIINVTKVFGDDNFANYMVLNFAPEQDYESNAFDAAVPLEDAINKTEAWNKFDYAKYYNSYVKDTDKKTTIYKIETLISFFSYTLDLLKTRVQNLTDDPENDWDTSLINLIPITLYKYGYYVTGTPFEYDKTTYVDIDTTAKKKAPLYTLSQSKYVAISKRYQFNPTFKEFTKYNKITQAINKVSSYAGLISKELDGKGKAEINDIQDLRKLEYSDYSLTTIFNFLVGGFEAIVNNQGSITDYSNYASLKYLIKSINNKLDLRSTYLTMLNVHKNKVLDLSTDLAKNNISVILGDETLEFLYSELDYTVKEINYLINLISTVLNKTYDIQDLESFYRYDKPEVIFGTYFKEIDTEAENTNDTANVDPLGINTSYYNLGKTKESSLSTENYSGILPLLESYLIELIGENHFGDERYPSNGKISLLDIYNNIKGGYTLNGLDQAAYEDFYERLNTALEGLTSIHAIINAFVNHKYISEIIDLLIGSLNLNALSIMYNGKAFNVNSLMEYYNEGLDPDLTQEKVMNLIANSVNPNVTSRSYPIEENPDHPIYMYPYFSMMDIKDSVAIASENLDIVKSNITKQDHVLATLNTLCYDNLVQDMSSSIGLAEGSDGDFTYDNSSSAKLKEREHKINDIRIKAYKGTWNPDVLNKDIYEFDHILDANYDDAVKNAIITLARDERQDFFYWADTKKQNTISDTIDWKTGFTNSTYFMAIYGQAQVWYDEYTSKNIELTTTYMIADTFPRHINNYGCHYPMAGSRRGTVGGFLSNSWYPNEDQKETLYKNKINYLERDISVIRYGSQNTNYPSGPLGSINNMLVMLKIKRKVEKIAKTYQFEFNNEETRSGMNAEINNYLKDWVNNGACTLATANVYSSNYDMIQKIVRVDVTLLFTGVIERVVINIDCPAQ